MKKFTEEELAIALENYTNPNHPEYDKNFDEEIRRVRPDWFEDSFIQKQGSGKTYNPTLILHKGKGKASTCDEILAAVYKMFDDKPNDGDIIHLFSVIGSLAEGGEMTPGRPLRAAIFQILNCRYPDKDILAQRINDLFEN